MDTKEIEELIELMRRSGLVELALEVPDYKISLKRVPGADSGGESRPAEAGFAGGEAETSAPEERPAAPRATTPVVSPVVGVFHNGGMLDPRQMVRAGDRVAEGQLLAAIEAMRVPNDLLCPVRGVVSRVLVEDGAPVEFGQTLFLIETQEAWPDGTPEAAG